MVPRGPPPSVLSGVSFVALRRERGPGCAREARALRRSEPRAVPCRRWWPAAIPDRISPPAANAPAAALAFGLTARSSSRPSRPGIVERASRAARRRRRAMPSTTYAPCVRRSLAAVRREVRLALKLPGTARLELRAVRVRARDDARPGQPGRLQDLPVLDADHQRHRECCEYDNPQKHGLPPSRKPGPTLALYRRSAGDGPGLSLVRGAGSQTFWNVPNRSSWS